MSKNRKRRFTGVANCWSYHWEEIGVNNAQGFFPAVKSEQSIALAHHKDIVSFRVTRKGRAADIKLA